MKIDDVLRLFNDEGLTLEEVGKELGTSKSSVYRLLSKHGYKFNPNIQKYVHLDDLSNETIENSLNEKINNVSNETTNNVSRTYQIPSDLDRALKIKCAIEGTKIVDVVRDALLNVVEEKYYKY